MTISTEYSKSLANRLKNPLIAFFITAWIFHNWELIIGLFTIKLPYDSLIIKLSPFFNYSDLLFFPLAKAIFLITVHISLGLFVHLLYDIYIKSKQIISDWINNTNTHIHKENALYRACVNALISNSYAPELIKDNSQDTLQMIKDYTDEAQEFNDIFEKQFPNYRYLIDPNTDTQKLPPKPKNKDLFIKNGIMEIRTGKAFYTQKGLFILFQIYPQLNDNSISRIMSESY